MDIPSTSRVDRFLRAVTQRLLARGYGPPQEPDSTQGKTEVAPGVLGYSTLDVELSTQRVDIYEDMDEIDDTVPEGSRALDVLADNAVNAEGGGLTSFVVTYERKVPASKERLIEEMLSRVRMREKAYAIARDAAKYGDNFQQIIVSRSMRIERLMYMPPETMRRNEDEHGLLKTGHEKGEWAFEQYEPNTTNLIAGFYPWQIEHLRWNRSGSSKYGRAQLYSARYAWKKWLAMQEALVVNWLTRAFVRLVFKLDTTGKKPAEAQEYLRGFMENLKRRTVASGMSGEEAMSVARDLAIGTGYISHNGQTVPMMTDVETLDTSNSGFWNVTAIEYWRNKFIAATGVPKAHLGLEQDINAKCVSLETNIPLLSGKTLTLAQIIKEYETTGKTPWVFSWDSATGKIVPGRVTWAGVTKRNTEVVEVELDDGTTIRTTPDHRFFDICGNEVEAQYLQPGQQLTPLVKRVWKYGKQGYIHVKDPLGQTVPLHRRIAETLWPDELGPEIHVHHIDRNKWNNDPANLTPLAARDHAEEHGIEIDKRLAKYREECGAWNKGITKASGDPRAESLRPKTYIQKVCENPECGKTFTVEMMLQRRRFCCQACAAKVSANERAVGHRAEMTCQYCGKLFVTTASRAAVGKGQYCSHECKVLGMRERRTEERVCEYCGETFTATTARQKNKQFCSLKCSNTYRNKARAGLIPVPNHRVRRVRFLTERIDTGDITVEGWHNFFVADASGGGVLVHNSTLQWQDERFARTVRRIQSMMSEFIAHLIDLELLLHGVNPQTVPYKIEWAPPSTMDQLERAQSLHYIGMAAERLLEWGIVDREWLRINALRQTPQQAQDLASRTQDRTPTEGGDG